MTAQLKDSSTYDPQLEPCPNCGGGVDFFTRWRSTGTFGNVEPIYTWIMCNGIPPCLTGGCFKTAQEAHHSWLQKIKEYGANA